LAGLATSSRQRFDNTTFRTVLFTGEHEQLTVMRLRPGEEIGREVHGSEITKDRPEAAGAATSR
jgi:hypothetical protein